VVNDEWLDVEEFGRPVVVDVSAHAAT
jgi:hypothetical protein